MKFASLWAWLAVIHLVPNKARGLGVNPGSIYKPIWAGDAENVALLQTIYYDEVTHATTGHRWFASVCTREGVDIVKAFREEERRGRRGDVKGAFNAEDHEKVGVTREFYENLKGEVCRGSKEPQASQIRGR